MKVQESSQLRSQLSYRARVAEEIAKHYKQSPYAELKSPDSEGSMGFRFLNRLFKFPARYEVASEEEFALALRKTVESGRTVRVHLSVDCSLKNGVSFHEPLRAGDMITSVSAEAKCSDNVTVSLKTIIDTGVKDDTKLKEAEYNERATCLGSLALLSFAARMLRDFPSVPVECGPSNILSNRSVLMDVFRIAERYGLEVPHMVAEFLPGYIDS